MRNEIKEVRLHKGIKLRSRATCKKDEGSTGGGRKGKKKKVDSVTARESDAR